MTSGTQTPFLKKAIGMAYVPPDAGGAGHGARHRHPRPRRQGRVVPLPFYKRAPSLGRSLERSDRMAYPTTLKYTKDHEWIRLAGDVAEVGITDYAQQQLGDVVYVDLPESARRSTAGQAFGSIESVKAVSELFAPRRAAMVDRAERGAEGPSRAVNTRPARDLDDQASTWPTLGRRGRCSTAAQYKPCSA